MVCAVQQLDETQKCPEAAASILFLDVDGVLNCGDQSLDSDKLSRLSRIISECAPGVVLTTTWRNSDRMLDRLIPVLLGLGSNIIGGTPSIPEAPRWVEIKEWLNAHGNPANFFILDDYDMGELSERHAQTIDSIGLTDEHVAMAIDTLGRSEYRVSAQLSVLSGEL